VQDREHHRFSGSRRLFNATLIGAFAAAAFNVFADGVQLGDRSALTQLVPAEEIEAAAAQQYRQLLEEAARRGALAPANHPQMRRLRYIAGRIVPFSTSPNLKATPRAAQWRWEVHRIATDDINAFCMPGGKIAFFSGILDRLQLTDDEVAIVMGHEMTHALREHAREQIGKSVATNGLIELGAALFGLGRGGRTLASLGARLLNLSFSRADESEADRGGLDLAARAGYDPQAGITLWKKMEAASHGSPPEWLSTHPAGPSRIQQIEALLPEVLPVYARAEKPSVRFG
jgi:Zn-dependent protease with chaperone function